MRRDDVQAMFKRIPEADHTKVCLVLAGGQIVNVDLLYRMDDTFVTVRGREAGSNDEGRAFFLPYDAISYMKIERMVMVAELESIFGVAPMKPAGPPPSDPGKAAAAALLATPMPPPPTDPAGIARANLLARIQAARTSAGVPNKGG